MARVRVKVTVIVYEEDLKTMLAVLMAPMKGESLKTLKVEVMVKFMVATMDKGLESYCVESRVGAHVGSPNGTNEGRDIDEERFWKEVDHNRQFTHPVEYYEINREV